ncbi:substrate-binding periplasmic protein [Duganella aceris]|jgi:polar amino acid transport system substrate-binding protein|uniref:Amino acid ABC transporter substrate-binding protein n=1 Tax=Duganella aceris TaxID=2703883 RepID=A0ABX0FKG7_9BURK|nr:transporter substrate-binding domain-containing protein [Duganella aceris]NGZ85048.1 amino acid ABC transporter substrate-binding protein [Duganella aceris]
MRRSKHTRIVVIAGLWVSLSGAHAGTECPPVTRVGLSDLGYSSFREANGKIGGISVDVVNEIARRTGCKFEFLWFPRQRLFVELEAGRIDMTMAALRTPERDVYARYLPYAYLQYDLVLSNTPGRPYTSLGDFVARGTGRLNVTRGMNYDAAVETQLSLLAAAGRLEVVNDFETVFGKLEMGRADGTLATPPIYTKYLKSGNLKDRTSVITLPEATPRFTGVYLSKKTVSTAARMRYAAALKTMVSEQVLPALYAKYFDDATVKRLARQANGPLLAALSAPE